MAHARGIAGRFGVWLAVLGLTGAGCAQILGADWGSYEREGGAGGAAGEGGSAPCVCVDPLPPDVTGPFHVYSTSGATPVQDCGNGVPVLFFVQSGEPDATCSACQCAPPAAPCGGLTFYLDTGFTCDGTTSNISATFADNNCHYIGDSDDSGRMATAPAITGSCTPSGGEIQSGAWGEAHGACLTSDVPGVCAGTQQCIAPPAAGGARLCVLMNDSAAPCPADWPEAVEGFRDTPPETRTCTPCTCGALSVDCGSAFRIYYPAPFACGGPSYIPVLNDCLDFSGFRWGKLQQPQGACTPSTEQIQGTFDPGTPATLCCKAPSSG